MAPAGTFGFGDVDSGAPPGGSLRASRLSATLEFPQGAARASAVLDGPHAPAASRISDGCRKVRAVSKGRIRSVLRRIGPLGIFVIIMAPVTSVLVAHAVQPTPPPAELIVLPVATPTTSASAQPSPPPPLPASPTTAPHPVVAFLGDSYAAGAGSSRPSTRWTDLVSQHLGWVEENLALTTASYSTAGEPGETSYRARIPALVATRAQIVVVSGGRADVNVGAARFRGDVRATLAAIHAAAPTAKIMVISPTWGNSPVPAKLTTLIAIVRAEAVRAGATYLNIGEPMAGKVALMAANEWQPNDAGHAAIAAAVEKALG